MSTNQIRGAGYSFGTLMRAYKRESEAFRPIDGVVEAPAAETPEALRATGTFTVDDIAAGFLTIVHDFGVQVVFIEIKDNQGRTRYPDSIYFPSKTRSLVGLSTPDIIGTWTWVATHPSADSPIQGVFANGDLDSDGLIRIQHNLNSEAVNVVIVNGNIPPYQVFPDFIESTSPDIVTVGLESFQPIEGQFQYSVTL